MIFATFHNRGEGGPCEAKRQDFFSRHAGLGRKREGHVFPGMFSNIQKKRVPGNYDREAMTCLTQDQRLWGIRWYVPTNREDESNAARAILMGFICSTMPANAPAVAVPGSS